MATSRASDPAAQRNRTLDFMSAIWALDHALHRMSKRMAATIGVTGPQRLVVRLLGRHPDTTAGTLAQLLHLHPSTVTGVLARLERNGLVRRRRDRTDGRSSRLRLTDRGHRIDKRRAGTIESAIECALAGAASRDVDAAIGLLTSATEALRHTHDRRPRARTARR